MRRRPIKVAVSEHEQPQPILGFQLCGKRLALLSDGFASCRLRCGRIVSSSVLANEDMVFGESQLCRQPRAPSPRRGGELAGVLFVAG
ncbi:MAG: hypothetical protein ABI614_21165 [Planctomycetota bacterium]